MQFRDRRGLYLLPGMVALVALLGQFGWLPFLWIFPLHPTGFGAWFLLATVDVWLARLAPESLGKFRPLLWCSGILWFSAAAGAAWMGVFLVSLPPVLWVASWHKSRFLLPGVLLLALVLLVFGHAPVLVHPGRVLDLRFSLHLLSAFLFFRLLSWALAIPVRKQESGFLHTMEYFLAPGFWLSPLHASYLTWRKPEGAAGGRPVLWILRGLAHAVAFGLVYSWIAPWLLECYQQGASLFLSWRFPAAGAALFLLAYLEKSRVSYMSAGFLRLGGFQVEPDFRAPWAANSLPDYWRRFHFWVWEFYLETLFTPASVWLSRRMGVGAALSLAIFATFFVGTTLSHYISYPAPLWMALLLGLLFGAFTALHLWLEPWMKKFRLGIPVTWISVFILYLLAYPAFGLGWSADQLKDFFR